jgi:hypothetical protein
MYALAPDVTFTPAEHGAVLLHHRTGRYWVVNDTGAAVLRGVLAGGTPADAAGRLAAAHRDTPRDQIEDHSRALLDRLVTVGLVTVGQLTDGTVAS